MEFKNKRVLVLGMAKSGVASALFLADKGARVTVSDSRAEAALSQEVTEVRAKGIEIETGGHSEAAFRNSEIIVISPGVPSDLPQLRGVRRRGVPVIGELELASRFMQGHLVAITGSNGKTTTTTLAGEIVAQRWKTLVGGNIGTPAVSFVSEATPDTYVVLEVSSFQLETIQQFRPEIAVVLNVTPDHLDRHGSFEAYAAAKARIFENQAANDFAVLNYDDETCRHMAERVGSQVRWFSRKQPVDAGAFVRDGAIIWRDGGGERAIMPVAEIPLKGAHNLENVLAAVSVGVLAKCEAGQIRAAVREFKAVEHRLQFIANIGGVEYYNDSKATNVDATIKALESFPANVHLILGGKDKGSDYTVLKPLISERVKRVYTIGAAAEKIESHLAGAGQPERAGTLAEAVRRAADNAGPGDVVLLAPACASFDQFQNYEHRGRVFRELVEQLAATEAKKAPVAGEQRTAKREVRKANG